MKTIFYNPNPAKIDEVYPERVVEELRRLGDIDTTVYSKADLLSADEKFADVEYIFSTWELEPLTEEEIRRHLPSLKAVFYSAGTVQFFARPFLNCGVKVFSAWAANAVPVAEYTVAQIILANKGYYLSAPTVKTKRYAEARKSFEEHYPGNFNVKVGIIGAGMIGKLVIQMLKAYRMDVLVFDPFLADEQATALGVKKVDLAELFSTCHVISNHLANNTQTQGMLKAEHFATMRPYATFINTGRGAQVVEKDLISVLRERSDLVAVLDVTDPEPPVESSPFYDLENCILTPHIAGSCGFEKYRMAEYMSEEFRNHLQGRPCKYEVTLKMLETMA
ncbi:MAG: hydroxyacid dehydrogenase [Ruminococcaceae bacterium]|nr:hydroxyacid dehydrogenase [Oscillospiraceae bacterium]